MTVYYNGEKVRPKDHQSLIDALRELGVSDAHVDTAIESMPCPCCPEFDRFCTLTEDDYDFGKDERVSVSMHVAIDMNENGFIHGWVPMRFCPFCGKSLRAKFEFKEEEE